MSKVITLEPIDGNVVRLTYIDGTIAIITRYHAQEYAEWVAAHGVGVDIVNGAIDEFRAERNAAAAEDTRGN